VLCQGAKKKKKKEEKKKFPKFLLQKFNSKTKLLLIFHKTAKKNAKM